MSTIANIAVAAGTLLLAWFTWQLARQTRDSVNNATDLAAIGREQVIVSERQARIAEEATAASVQPTLVDVPWAPPQAFGLSRWSDGGSRPDEVIVQPPSDNSRYISVPLRNLGPGVAVIRGLSVSFSPGIGWGGDMSNAIVGVGEATRLDFTIPIDRPELEPFARATSFSVWVSYTDIAGSRVFRTRADIHHTNDTWKVRQIGLYLGEDSSEPFVMSGPADAR